MMDLSIARSIYERAKAVKRSKNAADAEIVSNEYQAFQIANPYLPYVAPYVALNHYGSKIKILSSDDEVIIDAIIAALRPLFLDSNGNDFFIGKLHKDVGCLKAPITMTILKNQEPVRRIEKQYLKKTKTKELSLFLDSILKKSNFSETEWLEFKRYNSIPDRDILGKIFAGLSNTAFLCKVAYAYLIIGINESKKEICGTKVRTDSKNWELFERELRLSFKPGLEFEVDEFDYKNNPQKHTIIFTIHAANEGFISYCNKDNKKIVYIRKGDSTIPLDEGSNNFPQNSISAFSQSTDSPNYDKNSEKAHSVNQQPKNVINNIQFIIANPQFENCGNEYKNFQNKINNVNSHNSVKDSPNTNIGSNNQTTTLKESDYNSNKLDIKWIIGIIIAIIAIPFSGFAVKSCNSDEKNMAANSATIGNQNNQLNQHSQIIINGNNNTITNSNNAKTVNNQTYNSSVETSTQSIVSDSTMNELCLLYSRAIAIKTGKFQAGILTALMDDFNTFARKYTLDEVKPCIKIDAGAGRINKCGVDRLEKIKHRLNVFKMNHKINCNF